MEVVLDYNVVFSALYNRGVSYKLFMVNHVVREVDFLVPAYFWEEMEGRIVYSPSDLLKLLGGKL